MFVVKYPNAMYKIRKATTLKEALRVAESMYGPDWETIEDLDQDETYTPDEINEPENGAFFLPPDESIDTSGLEDMNFADPAAEFDDVPVLADDEDRVDIMEALEETQDDILMPDGMIKEMRRYVKADKTGAVQTLVSQNAAGHPVSPTIMGDVMISLYEMFDRTHNARLGETLAKLEDGILNESYAERPDKGLFQILNEDAYDKMESWDEYFGGQPLKEELKRIEEEELAEDADPWFFAESDDMEDSLIPVADLDDPDQKFVGFDDKNQGTLYNSTEEAKSSGAARFMPIKGR